MSDLLPIERARLQRQAAVRPGQMFVLVDTSVPGGEWVDEILYDSSREADREAEKLRSRYPQVQVIDAVWYGPSEAKLKALGMRAASDKVAMNVGTLRAFRTLASSKLTQYDKRLEQNDIKRGRPVNIYRLGHYFGALEKAEKDVLSRFDLDDDSPEALEAFKAALLRRFTSRGGVSDLAPIRNVIKQIDDFLATGRTPSLTRRAGRLQGEALYDALKKIVDEKQYAKINGQMVDLFSASAMVQVADALNERNRERFLSLPLAKAHAMTFKMLKGRTARFSEGPKGEKEFKQYVKDHPEFGKEWEDQTEAHEGEFTEESMMLKTDDAFMLPVEVEMHRLAAKKVEKGGWSYTEDEWLNHAQEAFKRVGAKNAADFKKKMAEMKKKMSFPSDGSSGQFDAWAHVLAWAHDEFGGSKKASQEDLLPVERAAARSVEAAGGLYGYTKRTQRDVEATIRKAQKQAVKIAAYLVQKDDRSIPFLKAHAKRARSTSARLLLAAMKSLGPKVAAKVASADPSLTASQANLYDALWFRALDDTDARQAKNAALAVQNAWEVVAGDRDDYRSIKARVASDLAGFWKHQDRTAAGKAAAIGLYGYPTRTAKLCLAACTDYRSFVGEAAYNLHSRREAKWERITGFMREHSKTARCGYTRLLLGCYPDSPSGRMASEEPKQAGKIPKALEKHQFGKGDDKKDKDKGDEKDDKDKGEDKGKDDKKKDDKLPAFLKDKKKDKKASSVNTAKRKAPPKEHQFTSEDNPNPKGNDRDGDGKTNEKKPFKEAGGDRYEVIESQRWVNKQTGATASVYGAVPWSRPSEKSDWERETVGWTVRDNQRGTVGIGRKPWRTESEAQAWADKENARLSKKAALAASWGPTLVKADFDANEIGAVESGGALEEDADEASYMNENFTEQETAELLMKQEQGILQDGQADDGPAKMASPTDTVAGWLEWQE